MNEELAVEGAAAPAAEAKMNLLAQAVSVFAAPGDLFRYLGEYPGWTWIAPALAAFAAVAVRGLSSAQLDAAQSQAEMQRVLATMPEETARQMASMMAIVSPEAVAVQFIVGSIISLLISWAACSAMLHLLSLVMGNHRSYRAMFAAVVWAWAPFILRDLTQAAFIFVNQKLILFPGLSALAAQSTSQLVNAGNLAFVAASHVDLFFLWNVILLTLAVAGVTGAGRIRSALPPLIYWTLVILLAWVLGAIGGALGGGMMGG